MLRKFVPRQNRKDVAKLLVDWIEDQAQPFALQFENLAFQSESLDLDFRIRGPRSLSGFADEVAIWSEAEAWSIRQIAGESGLCRDSPDRFVCRRSLPAEAGVLANVIASARRDRR